MQNSGSNLVQIDDFSDLDKLLKNHQKFTAIYSTKPWLLTKKLTVNVPSCSKSAADKIKRAGGEVLIQSQEQGE